MTAKQLARSAKGRTVEASNRSGMIALAFRLADRVGQFAARTRLFFYEVALSQHSCSRCQGKLQMVGESRCRCRACQHEFDPTLVFQRCPACDGGPRLRVRRYACNACGNEVVSRFLFDGLAFDVDYFRQKMAEHRRRRRDRLERVRQMLADSRSPTLVPVALNLDSVPGLLDALNELTSSPAEAVAFEPKAGFDLQRYQTHIQAHIQPFAISFEEIPPLDLDERLDRIWRFIAIIFLAHAGLIDVRQEEQTILVMQHEANGERQDVPGDIEDLDGVERPLGRVEA